MLRFAAVLSAAVTAYKVVPQWDGTTVQHLHREYGNIFRHGNRNAASHLWSSFILDRSRQMTRERFELMFSGFCAVSGSPVGPNDYNRYRLTLQTVTGPKRTGQLARAPLTRCCRVTNHSAHSASPHRLHALLLLGALTLRPSRNLSLSYN